MNDDEMITRASALPDRFAGRLPAEHVDVLRRIEGGGEWGMLVTETIAALGKYGIPASAAERDELRALATATARVVGTWTHSPSSDGTVTRTPRGSAS